MGYVLPWGNMSFWGAQVIVNLFGTIPGIGPGLVEWIRGDYGIADATLNRFFALHVAALPLALLLLVALHLVALRQTGSNNPDGIEIKEKRRRRRQAARRHPLSSLLHREGHRRRRGVVRAARRSWCSSCRPSAACSSRRRTSSRPIRCPRPSTSRRCGTSRPIYAILRAVPDQRMGALLMLLAVAGVPVRAVAGPLAGEVDALPRLDVAHGARTVRGVLRRARLSRTAAGGRPVRGARAHLRGASISPSSC